MIRRFVNLVAENYKTGMYSLHRLDVSKQLFHQSRADARVVPFLAEAQDKSGDERPTLDLLEHVPSAMATWSSSNVDYFSLLGSECRILCLNKVGTAVLYDPDSNSNFMMPGLNEFKGPVAVSVSVAPAAAGDKKERLYMMYRGPESDSNGYHFNVLRYGPRLHCPWSDIKGWCWQPLPVPPFFVDNPSAGISAYTVVDGGNTICLSSVADGVGTYYLNTVTTCEWKRAGDWVLPFTGEAEYISHLNLWLGFSLHSPGFLCAASDLSDMLLYHKPMSLIAAWPDHTPKEWKPKEWMTVNAKILNLGSGKFAVAKVFKAVSNTEEPGLLEQDTVEDEVVVLSGVELESSGNDSNNLRGLKLFQHKSIGYICANGTAIRYVL